MAFGLAVINLNFVQEGEEGGTEGGKREEGEGRREERGGRSGAGRGEEEGERGEGGGEGRRRGRGIRSGRGAGERRDGEKEVEEQQKQKIWESGEVACNK